jgi:hypothetical protein
VDRLLSLIETFTKKTTIITILWRLSYLPEGSFKHLQFSTFKQVQISIINSLGQARVYQLSICSQILMLSPMQLQLVLHLSQEQPLPDRGNSTKTISKTHLSCLRPSMRKKSLSQVISLQLHRPSIATTISSQ